MAEYDHVVIGAGIVGSWTALELTRLNKKVLLLEQFSEPHTRGSSHGQSRLIRSCYAEECFAEMMPFAFDMWRNLEKETNSKLMENCGSMTIFQTPDMDKTYKECLRNMQRFAEKSFDHNETREDLFKSHFYYKEKPHALIFDKTGGVLFAHKALLAIQELYKRDGGHLWNNCQVTSIFSRDDNVEINTSKGQLIAPSVVICTGAWTQKLLVPTFMSSLPLQPQVVKVYYWKEKKFGVHSPTAGFPAFIDLAHPNIYGLPSIEYPGLVKVCVHGGAACDPDQRDQSSANLELEKLLKKFVSEHMPLLEKDPAIIETCMYTVTPDEVFLIDRVPGHNNIIFGTGFSGTGFKTSPVVGKMLSEMATGQKPFLDVLPYSLKRFDRV